MSMGLGHGAHGRWLAASWGPAAGGGSGRRTMGSGAPGFFDAIRPTPGPPFCIGRGAAVAPLWVGACLSLWIGWTPKSCGG